MVTFNSGACAATLDAGAREAPPVPAKEELLGHDPADAGEWLTLDALPPPVVPIVDPSPLRKFVDQFDRFASDFHAFAAGCRSSLRP